MSAQQAMNTITGSVTGGIIAATKIASDLDEKGITDANNAKKQELMQQKADINKQKLISLKLSNEKKRMQNRALKMKLDKEANNG